MKIVFMGTPDFAVNVLQGLIDDYDVETFDDLTDDDIEEIIDNYGDDIINDLYLYPDVYQWYIVRESDVDLVKNDYPIYYCDELDLYIVGITHLGVGWDMVYTDVEVPQFMLNEQVMFCEKFEI